MYQIQYLRFSSRLLSETLRRLAPGAPSDWKVKRKNRHNLKCDVSFGKERSLLTKNLSSFKMHTAFRHKSVASNRFHKVNPIAVFLMRKHDFLRGSVDLDLQTSFSCQSDVCCQSSVARVRCFLCNRWICYFLMWFLKKHNELKYR